MTFSTKKGLLLEVTHHSDWSILELDFIYILVKTVQFILSRTSDQQILGCFAR